MRTMMRSVAFALFGAACACGGGSNSTPATPTPTPSASGSQSGATISIVRTAGPQSFTPSPATVAEGGVVTWKNNDGVTHHIVMNDGSLDTGDIAPGASSRALALATNGGNYHCTIHPTMVGSINASTGAPPPCQGVYCSSSK